MKRKRGHRLCLGKKGSAILESAFVWPIILILISSLITYAVQARWEVEKVQTTLKAEQEARTIEGEVRMGETIFVHVSDLLQQESLEKKTDESGH